MTTYAIHLGDLDCPMLGLAGSDGSRWMSSVGEVLSIDEIPQQLHDLEQAFEEGWEPSDGDGWVKVDYDLGSSARQMLRQIETQTNSHEQRLADAMDAYDETTKHAEAARCNLAEIVKEARSVYSVVEIAEQTGLSRPTIYKLLAMPDPVTQD